MANVTLGFVPIQAPDHQITINTTHRGFASQGNIENGHTIWNASAKVALTAALSHLALSERYKITILKLEGRLFIDTNNAAIGVACILALYSFLAIDISREKRRKFDHFTHQNWQKPADETPNFEAFFSHLSD